MATHHIEHDNSATNAILVVLLVVAALIFGYLLFRNGIPGAGPTGGSINVELPNTIGGGTGAGTGGDAGGNSGGNTGGGQ
ncbi:MAG TPA: hypothetical protein VEA18_03785 [Candidatus Kapabacteria bacterium]|nr:hypothetical protein [Candidatus Kapabacteria bacterium]